MGISAIISRSLGFIQGLVPSFFKLGDLLDNVRKMIKVGVEEGDVHKINSACDALDAVAAEIGDMQGELYELSAALRNAISENSEGGSSITFNEIIKLGDEASDIPREATELVTRIGELSVAVKAALKEN